MLGLWLGVGPAKDSSHAPAACAPHFGLYTGPGGLPRPVSLADMSLLVDVALTSEGSLRGHPGTSLLRPQPLGQF